MRGGAGAQAPASLHLEEVSAGKMGTPDAEHDDSQHPEDTQSASHHHHDGRDPAAHALLGILQARESEQKHEARAALEEFDRKEWRHGGESSAACRAHPARQRGLQASRAGAMDLRS